MRSVYEEIEEDLGLLLYTEKATNLIYEVQFYDDFALYRPASPNFRTAVERMNINQFIDEFEEFAGDHEKLRSFIYRGVPYGV